MVLPTGIRTEDRLLSVRQKDGMDNADDPSRFNPVVTRRAMVTYIDDAVFKSVFRPAVSNIVALKAIPPGDRQDRLMCYVEDDPTPGYNGLFSFDADSSDPESLPEVVQPDAGTGRWIQITKGVSTHNALGDIQGGDGTNFYHSSQDEHDALAGTQGTPDGTNKFVTDADQRIPSQDENDALVGSSGTPSTSNPFATNADPRLTYNFSHMAGRRSVSATNIYMWHELIPMNSSPYKLAADAFLVALSATTAANGTWTLEVYKNTDIVSPPNPANRIAFLTITADDEGYVELGTPVSLSAGDKLAFYINGTAINNPAATAFFRRR